MAKNQAGNAIVESRALQIAEDMASTLITPAEAIKKYSELFGVGKDAIRSTYLPKASEIISRMANEKYGARIRQALDIMHDALPEALLVLRKSIRDRNDEDMPTRSAITAAQIIIGKALPDKIEQVSKVSFTLVEEEEQNI